MASPTSAVSGRMLFRALLLLAVVGPVAACGGPDTPLAPGVIDVKFTPTAPAVPGFALQMGEIRLARVIVLGDTPPPGGLDLPPDQDLDLLGAAVQFPFTGFPPGVYSRVQLDYHAVMLAGTWKGTPFFAHIEPTRGTRVSVRSTKANELADGQNLTFPVAIDASSWFADNILDGAIAPDGHIICDDRNNQGVSVQLADRITASFSLP